MHLELQAFKGLAGLELQAFKGLAGLELLELVGHQEHLELLD